MRAVFLAAIVCVTACGGSDDTSNNATNNNETNCDFSAIHGTYRMHFVEQSGDCGQLPDANVLITAGASDSSTCTTNAESKDAASCNEDIDLTCPDSADDINVREVAHLDVQPDGSLFAGTITMTATKLSTGTHVCTSTYAVTYTRQ